MSTSNSAHTNGSTPNANGITSSTDGNTSSTNGNTSSTNGNTSSTNGNTSSTNGNISNSLRTRLRNACETNPRDNKLFISRRQLEEICNEQAVAQELATAFRGKYAGFHEEYALAICHGQAFAFPGDNPEGPDAVRAAKPGVSTKQTEFTVDQQATTIRSQSCRKIFAVLVLMNQVKLIESFLKHPLCDNDLPLQSTKDFTALWSDKKGPENPLYLPDGYDDYDVIQSFIHKQWSVLVPCFEPPATRDLPCNVYDWHEDTILPIYYISKKQYPGGFGLVEKVKIHGEHNGFNHESFALKTLHPMIPEERDRFFEQELKAFRKVKSDGHIIEICAAFKKGASRGFLFPWAKGGTLNHLWAKPPGDIIATAKVQWSEFSLWICIQCRGIIRDLGTIHEPYDMPEGNGDEDIYGIHSDIKPDNILYFSKDGPPLGLLKVSDLGLMKFHRLISRTVQSKSMGHAYQTYRAPEHDMGKVRSRKIDIWAFGCLFAEFLTWAIGGEHAIEAFKTKRLEEDKRFPDEHKGEWAEDNFFVVKTNRLTQVKVSKRKSSVDEWFTALIKDLGPDMANTFFPQFLRFIQNSMLDPDRKHRADCEKVESFLGKLLEKPPNSPYWRFNGTVPYPKGYSRSTTGTGTWNT